MLASGFKTHRLLESFGFHGGTHIIVYDYSAPAVALRRMMVEEWDGRNFGAFFTAARERLGHMFPGMIVYHPATSPATRPWSKKNSRTRSKDRSRTRSIGSPTGRNTAP